jgi:hypothetical protein
MSCRRRSASSARLGGERAGVGVAGWGIALTGQGEGRPGECGAPRRGSAPESNHRAEPAPTPTGGRHTFGVVPTQQSERKWVLIRDSALGERVESTTPAWSLRRASAVARDMAVTPEL